MQPKLLFGHSTRNADFVDAKQRGYRNDAVVLIGKYCYKVSFADIGEVTHGVNSMTFFAEPGSIILPEVTLENMVKAVEKLYEQEGYFECLHKFPASKYKDYKEADVNKPLPL
jgi:hypothetical protein